MHVLLPDTLDEACAMRAETPAAIPIAGGTDLFVDWPRRFDDRDHTYIDLSHLDELRKIHLHQEHVTLGALTTYWDVVMDQPASIAFPLLALAARQVGSLQIQMRGTWVGNIMNASPAADGTSALMACDAVVELQSVDGVEEIPLDSFFTGYRQTRCRPGQLVRAIRIPRCEYSLETFEKVGARRAMTISKVGIAITQSKSGWRVVANSVAPIVCRCAALEQFLEHQHPVCSPDDLLAPIDQDVSPIDDLRSTAAYRRTVLSRLLYIALRNHCPWFT